MYIFYISNSEVKSFMNKLLRGNDFDFFETRSVEIVSFVKFQIIANLTEQNSENNNDKNFFCKWKNLKNYIFDFIKGKTKPKFMKIVISADSELCGKISSNAAALFLNLVFENDVVTCTTGSSQKDFSLNKEVEENWEKFIKDFFISININVSENI